MVYLFVKALLSLVMMSSFASAASAGLFTPRSVDVDIEFGVASGDLRTARHDPNPYVGIGCSVKSVDFAGSVPVRYGVCQANDAEGDYVLCYTESEVLLQEIRAIDDTSWINFSFRSGDTGPFSDESYECTAIGSRIASVYLRD